MPVRTVPASEIRRDTILRRDGQSWLVSDHMPLIDANYVAIHAECVDGNVGQRVKWTFATIDPVTILTTTTRPKEV